MCALPSPNAPGRAPNHIHTTLRWGRAPGKPSLPVSTKKFSDPPATSSCTLGSNPMMVICDRWAG